VEKEDEIISNTTDYNAALLINKLEPFISGYMKTLEGVTERLIALYDIFEYLCGKWSLSLKDVVHTFAERIEYYEHYHIVPSKPQDLSRLFH
jgi:hypothetical protein